MQNLSFRRFPNNLARQIPTQLEVSTTLTVKQVPSSRKNDVDVQKKNQTDVLLLERPRKPFEQLQCEFNSFSTETTISAKTILQILRRRKLIGRAAAKTIFYGRNQGSNGWSGKQRGRTLKFRTGNSIVSLMNAALNWGVMEESGCGAPHENIMTSNLLDVCPMISAQYTFGSHYSQRHFAFNQSWWPVQRPGLRQHS